MYVYIYMNMNMNMNMFSGWITREIQGVGGTEFACQTQACGMSGLQICVFCIPHHASLRGGGF